MVLAFRFEENRARRITVMNRDIFIALKTRLTQFSTVDDFAYVDLSNATLAVRIHERVGLVKFLKEEQSRVAIKSRCMADLLRYLFLC